jgi:hypothetical protein
MAAPQSLFPSSFTVTLALVVAGVVTVPSLAQESIGDIGEKNLLQAQDDNANWINRHQALIPSELDGRSHVAV